MSENKPRVIGDNSMYQFLLGWVRDLEPGTAHQANLNEHFTCTPQSFAQVVYAVARQRGYAATVATFEDCVVFSFYKPDAYLKPNLKAYPVVVKMRKQF